MIPQVRLELTMAITNYQEAARAPIVDLDQGFFLGRKPAHDQDRV